MLVLLILWNFFPDLWNIKRSRWKCLWLCIKIYQNPNTANCCLMIFFFRIAKTLSDCIAFRKFIFISFSRIKYNSVMGEKNFKIFGMLFCFHKHILWNNACSVLCSDILFKLQIHICFVLDVMAKIWNVERLSQMFFSVLCGDECPNPREPFKYSNRYVVD